MSRPDGFHDGIPEAEYHADRDSLSVSGAKVLLRAPALFRWQQDHPVRKAVFDIGSAAHKLVLGIGPDLAVIDADSWRSKAAKEAQAEAYAAGKIPVLTADSLRVHGMANALSSNTLAMRLLSDGRPEVSAYARHPLTGVTRRGRFDWLGSEILTDYKTAACAEPGAFARAAATFGYHQQAAWYLDLAGDLGHPAQAFAFVVQEKLPPYLSSVVELDAEAVHLGRRRNWRALERFRDCTDTGLWPGYQPDGEFSTVPLPRWAHYEEENEA